MRRSLNVHYADPIEANGPQNTDNPVVSVDYDGKVLSRFDDTIWVFPDSKARPSSRNSVRWPDECAHNVNSAKQLAYLCLTHGHMLGARTARRKCWEVASLAAFCANEGVTLKALSRHPQVAIDYCESSKSAGRKSAIIAVARLALAMRDTLGWTLLESDQIAALEKIRPPTSRQYPVIPLRIHSELDNAAHAILSGYLAVADQLDEVCGIWGQANTRERRNTANWQHLMSQRPLLDAELSKWAGKATSPVSGYVSSIRSAACWVIAAGSSARRQEILSLRRGCLTHELVGEGMAHLLSGPTTKTQKNPHAIWVVSPRVERAIHALERLLDWYERAHSDPPKLTDSLFQVFDFTLGRHLAPSHTRKGRLQFGEPIYSVNFEPLMSVADTRITDDDWAEAKRFTPNLDERKFVVGKNWVPSTHQLRRSVLVYATASGLVSLDSVSYQAKHETWAMARHYTKYFWEAINTGLDNPLVAGTRRSDAEEFTRIFAAAYNRARSSAMEDDRFFSPYGRDHKRSVIAATPILSLEEIRKGLAHAVLKRNTLGLCAQAEHCEWQKAITVRGCMTKANGGVCGNAVIDAHRLGELQAVLEDVTCQLETLHARDTFAREQLEADISATARAIAMIEQHQRGQNAEA